MNKIITRREFLRWMALTSAASLAACQTIHPIVETDDTAAVSSKTATPLTDPTAAPQTAMPPTDPTATQKPETHQEIKTPEVKNLNTVL